MTRCEIDLDRFDYNIERVKELAGESRVMAVIKADAYGHGAAVLMRRLFSHGIRYFGVANIGEAMELRRTFHRGNILVLGYTPPHLMHYASDYGVALTVFTEEQAEALNKVGQPASIHIKLNTGLNRLGFGTDAQAAKAIAKIAKMENITIEGIFSHLAQGSKEDDMHQYEVFTAMTGMLESMGVNVGHRHISDGIALGKYEGMHLDMVRPGAMFYGYGSGVKPIMSLKSQIIHIHKVPAGEGISYGLTDRADHDRIIATLPYGYSDGVPRLLSQGRGHVTIKGKKAPYVGVLCMDMCMVDISDIEGLKVGDEVTVFGSGENDFTFTQAAEACGVNVNSLTSGIARRVPRVYFEKGKEVMFTDYLF